jgi:hypothetical protein
VGVKGEWGAYSDRGGLEDNAPMIRNSAIRLEFSTGRGPLESLDAINGVLKEAGAHVAPLDLSGAPVEIRQLLAQTTLTPAENEQLKAHFLLPRERLLEIIAATGQPPNVPGGGELTTFDATNNYHYPQLWVAQNDLDYSRFDRFHVNSADDGTAVNEVGQLLAGGALLVQHRLPDGAVLTLSLDCPGNDRGWLVTYTGGKPHIGSLSKARPGTKVLAQVIGPARWSMRYAE